MKKFSVLAFLFFSFCVSFASAQETGVKGKVRAANEKPLADATITARQNGKDVKTIKSDAKGNFQMTGLAPGEYNFLFEKEGFAAGVKYNVKVRKDAIVDFGDRLILGVDPGTLVFIRGSVFTPEGKSFPGADVKIERISADGKTKKVGSGSTNDSGEFGFRFNDTPAKYRVTASAKGVTETKEIEVSNAAVYRVAFTLSPNKSKENK
jgi:hypothetical protein